MDLKDAAETANNIIASAAIIVGGIWAYFKFIRGRTFARRAELNVSSSVEMSARSSFLLVTVKLKNTGLSKIPINDRMKAVRLSGAGAPNDDRVAVVDWQWIKSVAIFDQHDWVEAQETIADTVIFNLPGADRKEAHYTIYEVEAVVGARRRRITGKGTRWQSRTVTCMPTVDAPGRISKGFSIMRQPHLNKVSRPRSRRANDGQEDR